ncbi:response regulator [Deinococcus aquiradiocola]|uniref:Response regulatory domain-containing protein n=1 Tax=Deinococcus aquiradiocola TaxID=393059 RepID=A0A917PBT3_9DEIO|nr:response regulator [Deinococcus aquiradiocola]GGJ69796.1 hypothetical protein GCM10008939_12740 [Deinococcus aquiradiocola]
MTRLLIVLPDEITRRAVSVLAEYEGYEVTSADSRLHALTQLERNTPDVVLCDDRPGDLSSVEFHEIIRSEPGTQGVPLLLVTDRVPGWFDTALDVPVGRDRTSRELVEAITDATTRLARDPVKLTPLTPAPVGAQMRGTLEIVNLFDLIVSFNQMRKTGRIMVTVGNTEAVIYLMRGEVWHIEYGGHTGQQALLNAFADTEVAPTSSFAFAILPEPLVELLPRTSLTSTSRLLLDIAVHLDHVRSARQAPAPQ